MAFHVIQCYPSFKITIMTDFNKQAKFNESIYETLECAFDNENQECIVDEILTNITYADVSKVLEILVAEKLRDERIKKHLKHFKDTSVGLWCTDRPDLINDKDNLLFELK